VGGHRPYFAAREAVHGPTRKHPRAPAISGHWGRPDSADYRFEGKQKTLALGVYARGMTVREIPKLDATSLKRNARLPAQANSQPEKA
jgi:hypothetical protein